MSEPQKNSSCLSGCIALTLSLSTIILSLLLALAFFLRITAFEPTFYKPILAQTDLYNFVTKDAVLWAVERTVAQNPETAEIDSRFPLTPAETSEFLSEVVHPSWLKLTLEAKIDSLSGYLWGMNSFDSKFDLRDVKSRLDVQLNKYGEAQFAKFEVCANPADNDKEFTCKEEDMTYAEFLETDLGKEFTNVVARIQNSIPDTFDLFDETQFAGSSDLQPEQMLAQLRFGYQVASVAMIVIAGIVIIQIGILFVMLRRGAWIALIFTFFAIALTFAALSFAATFDLMPFIARIDLPVVFMAKVTEIINAIRTAMILRMWLVVGIFTVLCITCIVIHQLVRRLAKAIS